MLEIGEASCQWLVCSHDDSSPRFSVRLATNSSGRETPHSARLLLDYSHSMNNKKLFFKADKAGFLLGAVLLATLTGCYVEGPRAGVYAEPQVFVVQDDYVYYPGYEVYYSSSRRQYTYREGNAWVARPAPRGVSVNVLLASPSVRMDFHDSPAQHHAAVVKQYPKNWAPSASNQGQNRRDDQHDDHGQNNGR